MRGGIGFLSFTDLKWLIFESGNDEMGLLAKSSFGVAAIEHSPDMPKAILLCVGIFGG
ncbi:MAG: hypothetical protein WCL14_00165 [Bacteroidota bacterium]